MAVTRPCYATREEVAEALDVKLTARAHRQIDNAVEAASDEVDRLCHRVFWPVVDTREFDWPDRQSPTSWRLWLGPHELVTLTGLTAGGQTIDPGDVMLYPVDGPPYTRIEIDLSSAAAFGAGNTHQQTIQVTGLFGYRADETDAGELAAAVDTTSTTVTVTDATAVGVGDLIRADGERMLVTGRASLDTGQTLTADMAAQASAVTLTVADGSTLHVGETITVDAERMRVDDITGNSLTVRRAWDGSVLAAHAAGAHIYAPRALTVARGVGGTTPAPHDSGTRLWRHVAPGPVRQLTRGLALFTVLSESAGWARTAGSGENEREVSGRGIAMLRRQVYDAYARKTRIRSV